MIMSGSMNSPVAEFSSSLAAYQNQYYDERGYDYYNDGITNTTRSSISSATSPTTAAVVSDFIRNSLIKIDLKFNEDHFNVAKLPNVYDEGTIDDAIFSELTTQADLSISLSTTTENYVEFNKIDGQGESPNEVDFWMFFNERNLRHSFGWTMTLIIAYLIILIMGIIGNCMVILVVLLRPQMRTVTNMFIMNLAVADLFVIVFCVPATLLSNVLIPWILGSFMCKSVAYVQGVSVCASAYSLVAISLDRCKAIYRPMERPRGLSKSQALFTICLIWFCALLMTIPWAVVFDVIKSDKDGLTYCVETWENELYDKIYFLVANLICYYSLPLILISISNIVIWCHVSKRKVPQESAAANTIKRMHRRTKNGVRKMLGIVTLTFLISWLPLYILVTRVKFSNSESMGETESNLLSISIPIAQLLGSWNSSINPVLYAFLNAKFRDSFKSLLPSWFPFVTTKPRTNFVTNGTVVGTAASPSYTTVYTARSSGRSNNSRRFHYHKSYHHQQARTLVVNDIRSNNTTITTHIPAPPPSPNFPSITDL